ncbi:MAG: hypothetical protein RLZZ227_2794 [Pseudomonadota bacterium]|jgi:hypothetical protein
MQASLHDRRLIAMSDMPGNNSDTNPSESRQYEQSGCYPDQGKAFRVWALLGWLTFVIVALAGAAAALNIWLLPPS